MLDLMQMTFFLLLQLSRLKFPEAYAEVIKQNDINGQTLLFSDPADLRQVMQMTLGEWTAFRIHFLGITSCYCQKSAPVISNANSICTSSVCKRSHVNQI